MSYRGSIEQRLHILDFDKKTKACLMNIQPILEPSIDHVLDGFYEQLSHDPEIKALFPTPESITQARNIQREHWIHILFNDEIGKAHFDKAKLFGHTHESTGLSLGIYLGGYCIMMNQFLKVITDHYHDDSMGMTTMIHALHKAVFLDIDSVINSYMEVKNNTVRKVLIQAEQFSAGLKELNTTLSDQATNLQTYISALHADTKVLDRRAFDLDQKIVEVNKQKSNVTDESNLDPIALLNEVSSILKANREIYHRINKAEQLTTELAHQINGLNSHYDMLQDKHKCHYKVSQEQPMLQRVKSFFSNRLH
jgi:hypothetical protein